MNQLDLLATDDLALAVSAVALPSTLRRFLSTHACVKEVTRAVNEGVVSEDGLREWVASKLTDLRRGERFQHDIALSALSVALERVPTDVAESYLTDLAALKIHEIPMATRVAAACLAARRRSLSENSSTQFVITSPEKLATVASPVFRGIETTLSSHTIRAA